MSAGAPQPLDEVQDLVDQLRSEAKSAERRARVLKQLAARAAEKIETLQSKEDTR